MSTKPGKKCTSCLRPIKGHPIPSGKACALQPIYSEEELEEKKNEDNANRLENDRKRKATEEYKMKDKKRKATEEYKMVDKKRKATEECKMVDKKRKATEEYKMVDKKRKATDKYKEADRKRKAREKCKLADKKRKAEKLKTESKLNRSTRLQKQQRYMKLLRKRKLKMEKYKAWCDPYLTKDKPKIDLLSIPPMTLVCSDCNALMFPFELHRKKPDGGITFSLCCGYGR
jgi:hypothetical protein